MICESKLIETGNEAQMISIALVCSGLPMDTSVTFNYAGTGINPSSGTSGVIPIMQHVFITTVEIWADPGATILITYCYELPPDTVMPAGASMEIVVSEPGSIK